MLCYSSVFLVKVNHGTNCILELYAILVYTSVRNGLPGWYTLSFVQCETGRTVCLRLVRTLQVNGHLRESR